MVYKNIKIEKYYSSVIPYKDGLVKGGHYDHNFDLYYNNHFIASNVDTAPGIVRIYSNVLFYSSNSKGYYFDLNTFENKVLNESIIFSTFYENTFLSLRNLDKNDWSYELCLCQLEPFKVLNFVPNRHIGSIYRLSDLVVNLSRKGNSITLRSLSLLTGEYEWEVDLGEKLGTYDSIAKIVGVVDEVLWVISQRGILFGIEINTGELLYHLNYDNVDSFKETGEVNAKYFHSLFDEANKKFIGIYRTQCWEIDLTNPTTGLQVFDLEAINPTYFSHPDFYFRGSYWAAPEGVTFDNDYIYFRDIEVATVGMMHRQTKKIEWHTRLNDQEPMVRDVINDVQVSENKLYVLDTGGSLHIFEKETS